MSDPVVFLGKSAEWWTGASSVATVAAVVVAGLGLLAAWCGRVLNRRGTRKTMLRLAHFELQELSTLAKVLSEQSRKGDFVEGLHDGLPGQLDSDEVNRIREVFTDVSVLRRREQDSLSHVLVLGGRIIQMTKAMEHEIPLRYVVALHKSCEHLLQAPGTFAAKGIRARCMSLFRRAKKRKQSTAE